MKIIAIFALWLAFWFHAIANESQIYFDPNERLTPIWVGVSLFSGYDSGHMFVVGSENIKLDIIGGGTYSGEDVRVGFDVGEGKLWLGVGRLGRDVTIEDYSTSWVDYSKTFTNDNKSVFIQYDTSNNIFIRFTHYEGTAAADFVDMENIPNAITGKPVPTIVDQREITKEVNNNTLWIGYNWTF